MLLVLVAISVAEMSMSAQTASDLTKSACNAVEMQDTSHWLNYLRASRITTNLSCLADNARGL